MQRGDMQADRGRQDGGIAGGGGARRLLLRLLMRLQAGTLPCMSWAPAAPERAEAEAAGRCRAARGPGRAQPGLG